MISRIRRRRSAHFCDEDQTRFDRLAKPDLVGKEYSGVRRSKGEERGATWCG